jgi:hypothetical protein
MNTACTSHCWKIPRNLSQENKDTCAWLITVDHRHMNISMDALCYNNNYYYEHCTGDKN